MVQKILQAIRRFLSLMSQNNSHPCGSIGGRLAGGSHTPVICTGLFVEQSPSIDSTHQIRPFQVRPPPFFCHHPPDVLISSNSYAGQIPGLMMDNLPKVGTAHRHAASLWMPYGQKQLFSLLSLAQMCQTGCRLQSALLLALGGGCFLLAWQLITLM